MTPGSRGRHSSLERRTSSPARKRERMKATKYSLAIGLSLYLVIAFYGIRMIGESHASVSMMIFGSCRAFLMIRQRSCLARNASRTEISRVRIFHLYRVIALSIRSRLFVVSRISRSTDFISDWKGAKRSRSLRARDFAACWRCS